MINNLISMAMNRISSNPNIQNQPLAKELLEVLRTGDYAKGEQMAKKLCETYHTTPEEALKNAQNYFKFK